MTTHTTVPKPHPSPNGSGAQPYYDPNKYSRYSGDLGVEPPPEFERGYAGCLLVCLASSVVTILTVVGVIRLIKRLLRA